MGAFIVLIGLLVGVFLNWASDYLPRFSDNAPAPDGALRTPIALASLQIVVARLTGKPSQIKWLALHSGVEVLNAAAYGFLYARYGLSGALVFYTLIFSFLLLIAEVDLKYRLVLNVLIYPSIVAVLIGQVIVAQHSSTSMLLGGGLAFGIFFLTARLRPGDLGSGDVKLVTLIGLAFGFPGVLWALIVGAGSGAVVAVALALTRRSDGKLYFPYAPFLCLGAMVALLYMPFLTAL